MNLCLFCGGDASEPDHLLRCDGRQGAREAERAFDPVPVFEPLLIAGAVPATWETSAAAALSVEASKDTQRAEVERSIVAGDLQGRTDDEIQLLLNLDGSSERPRRWELWKLGRIDMLRDDTGAPVRRLTRTQRRAVVWVATAVLRRRAV